ncbi:MAG: DNA mismatch repair protein MutS, partial [Alphaproteobacteria bacterium]
MTKTLTPMMKQYFEIKSQHPDTILFYRMGDFYEMFFDDAIQASKVLDIALTHRGKDLDDLPIPMCGVPHHSHEPYLNTLISAGFRVAICEQIEAPEEAKKRGYKAIVKRGVVRVVSSGTLTENSLLKSGAHNYLLSFIPKGTQFSISWVDLSTGHFFCETTSSSLVDIFERLDPKEVLVSDDFKDAPALLKDFQNICFTQLPANRFSSLSHQTQIEKALGISNLFSLGDFSTEEVSASGTLIDYISLTSHQDTFSLLPLQRLTQGKYLQIDGTTRKSLELTHSLSNEKNTTLFWTIDRTKTAGGKRLLKRFFDHPLTDKITLDKRYDLVDFFSEKPAIASLMKKLLPQITDIERILSRIIYDRASPRDLGQLKDTLLLLSEFQKAFENDTDFFDFYPFIEKLSSLIQTLQSSLAEDLPYLARSGGVIRDGYDGALDQLRTLAFNGEKIMNQLQDQYRTQSGISQIKIKNNGVIGYFIEVSPKYADYFMNPENGFIHRQTMANAVRFTTTYLNETEHKLKSAQEKSLAVEVALFETLCEKIKHEKE